VKKSKYQYLKFETIFSGMPFENSFPKFRCYRIYNEWTHTLIKREYNSINSCFFQKYWHRISFLRQSNGQQIVLFFVESGRTMKSDITISVVLFDNITNFKDCIFMLTFISCRCYTVFFKVINDSKVTQPIKYSNNNNNNNSNSIANYS